MLPVLVILESICTGRSSFTFGAMITVTYWTQNCINLDHVFDELVHLYHAPLINYIYLLNDTYNGPVQAKILL